MRATIRGTLPALLCVAMLGACGEQAPGPPPAPAVAVVPSDPALAKLYAQTCKSCHATPGSGAPQAGDRQAWKSRMAQGMPLMLDRTIGGYKGMPPLGSCADCSEADFEALIRFMAGEES